MGVCAGRDWIGLHTAMPTSPSKCNLQAFGIGNVSYSGRCDCWLGKCHSEVRDVVPQQSQNTIREILKG